MTEHLKSEPRPFIPLLVGQGKLAHHLSTYFTQKSIPHERWLNARDISSANLNGELSVMLSKVSAVWILVSDSAIEEVALKLRKLAPTLPFLHASAATEVAGVMTLHPLQTFGPETYTLASYEEIPFIFVREEWQSSLALKKSIQAVLANPTVEIPNAKRALYHAYCVMMANFPQILWSEVTNESEQTLNEGRILFAPILNRAVENFINRGKSALTGPLVRGDTKTIERHLTALHQSRLLPIYQAFVKLFSQSVSAKKETA